MLYQPNHWNPLKKFTFKTLDYVHAVWTLDYNIRKIICYYRSTPRAVNRQSIQAVDSHRKGISHRARVSLVMTEICSVSLRTGDWPLARTPMGKLSISVELGDLAEKTGMCFKYLQCTICRQRQLTHCLWLIIFTVLSMVPD